MAWGEWAHGPVLVWFGKSLCTKYNFHWWDRFSLQFPGVSISPLLVEAWRAYSCSPSCFYFKISYIWIFSYVLFLHLLCCCSCSFCAFIDIYLWHTYPVVVNLISWMFKYACPVALNWAAPPPFLFLPPSALLSFLVWLYFLFACATLNQVHKYVHSSLKYDWDKNIF